MAQLPSGIQDATWVGVALFLVQHGANLSQPNSSGITPIDFMQDQTITNLLLETNHRYILIYLIQNYKFCLSYLFHFVYGVRLINCRKVSKAGIYYMCMFIVQICVCIDPCWTTFPWFGALQAILLLIDNLYYVSIQYCIYRSLSMESWIFIE